MRCCYIIIGHYRKLGDSRIINSILKFQKQYPEIIFDNHLYVSFDNDSGKSKFHKKLTNNNFNFDDVKKKLNFCNINTYIYINNREDAVNYNLDLHNVFINNKKYNFSEEKKMHNEWSYFSSEKGKICNKLWPQFFSIKKAYEFVKEYEKRFNIEYDIYIRSRTDLFFDNFYFNFSKLNIELPRVCVPYFSLHDGISDHIAFCNKKGANIYFNAEYSFRNNNMLFSREKCLGIQTYRKRNKSIPNKIYDNTHNILQDHLLSNECDVVILNNKVNSNKIHILR